MIKSGLILLFLITTFLSFGQLPYREFSFNSPGNPCYFMYVNHAPNGNLATTKRPFIFILGERGKSAKEMYEKDPLRKVPDFYSYEFVYLPNNDKHATEILYCLVSLTDLITSDYACGRTNVFLSIYDTTVTENVLTDLGLYQSFHSIRLLKPEQNTALAAAELTTDFKEDVAAYTPVYEDDEFGTYYEEDADDQEESEVFIQAKKTYFGDPSAFDFTLTGVVRDKYSGESLPFSSVKLKGSNRGATANVDGLFTLLKIPTDTSVLVVSYSGYNTQEVYLTPQMNKHNLIIELTPVVQLVNAVKVVADRQDVVLSKKEDVGVIKMTPKIIERLPNIGEKDIMRSFQLMPGVSGSQESSSGMYVRGGTPDQNLVLYDGFTVYHVDHLYGFFSAFNANTVKEVQLYKGGYESRFGGRLSSVTEITGKEGNQKKFNLGGDLSLLSINAFTEIPIGEKFTSIIAFRRSFKSPIYKKLFKKLSSSGTSDDEEEDDSSNPGGGPGGPGGRSNNSTQVTSFFYDLNGKFTYKPSTKDILSLSIFISKDKVDNSFDFDRPSFGSGTSNFTNTNTDLTTYGNIGSSLRWGRKWNDKIYGNTILSFSNFYSKRDQSNERSGEDENGDEFTSYTGILEDNNLIDYSFKSDYTWDVFKNSQLQFGVFATYYDIDYQYVQNDTATILNKSNKTSLSGGFIQNKFKFFNGKLVIVPGIRSSYYQTTRKFYNEPRASFVLKMTKNISLKGATGKYYQYVNRVTREDIMSGSKEFWLLSDGESVPVSSSVHYMGGISFETNQFLFSTEAYYKNIYNITEYSLRFNPSPMSSDYEENFFSGNGDARGVEFLVQRKTGKLNGWMSYTLGEARSRFDVYSDTYFYANQDVTHEFKSVLMYEYKRWNFSATWIFATGRPYTAPSGAYTITLLDGTTQDFFTVTDKNGLRLPNYHRADISVHYKLLAGIKGERRRKEIGSIGFSIFNLYNRKNVWYKIYTIEDGSILETDVNYTGFTPNLTLSLKIR